MWSVGGGRLRLLRVARSNLAAVLWGLHPNVFRNFWREILYGTVAAQLRDQCDGLSLSQMNAGMLQTNVVQIGVEGEAGFLFQQFAKIGAVIAEFTREVLQLKGLRVVELKMLQKKLADINVRVRLHPVNDLRERSRSNKKGAVQTLSKHDFFGKLFNF